MTPPLRIAAIDIGTVTTRLLVADVSSDDVAEVERSTDITHLGEGLTDGGALAPEAIERVSQVVETYSDTVRRLGVEHVRAMATSASRDAANSDELVTALARSGIVPEVIEGACEAELTFLGATSRRTGDGILVVDCGGGSTELVLGDVSIEDGVRRDRITAARSIDVGSRRLTELYLHSDPPTRSELAKARLWTVGEMRPYFEWLDERPQEMVAVAGTATTLAAIELGLVEYDSALVDGFVLSGSHVSEILEMLAAIPLAKRLEVTGLHPGRAGVIVAGTLILETVMALAGVDEMVVSECDILYGILIDTYRHLQESADEG